MRLGSLSATAAVAYVWLAARFGAQVTVGSAAVQAMLEGPKEYLAGGNSRDVFLIDYEGEKLVLKVAKHHSSRGTVRHLKEAIALDVRAVAADPKATGEAIDAAANDPVKNSNGKRAYPEPNIPIERSGAAGGKGSYTNRFKLNAAACTREICPCDGQRVGNNGAAKVLGVPQKRIIDWLKQEEQLREVIANPKLSKAKQSKQHRGCGNQEVMRKLLELKPDALGGMPTNAKPEEALAFKVSFNSWYQRFRKRNGFSIRRRTSVGQKLPKGYEGMAWATVVKVREALVKRAGEIFARRHPPAPGKSPIKEEDLTSEQLASVEAEAFEELGNMDQTPVQHEMPVETTLEKTGAKDTRISTGGFAAHDLQGHAVHLPAVRGKGKNTLPRKNSVAWEILPANRAKHGHPANGMFFGVQERSWSDQRECNGWISGSWKLRPNNDSIIQQRPCILVLDDFKCHKDEGIIAALKKDANTIVVFIPGGLTPLLQPLDHMLNKQMKRLLRGMCTAYSASAVADVQSGKLKPPGRGVVSTWCKEAWASITPETLPKVPEGFDSNPITAAQKEVEGKLLSYVADESDSEVEVLEGDSDVEEVEGQGGGGAKGEVLGAPYIAPTLGFCHTTSVQPLFSRGTVEQQIFEGAWTGQPIGMPAVLQMSLDAMRGLQVQHEAPGGPIIHNAMRPEQLLVYGNGTVVVSDLNSCTFMGLNGSGEPCRTTSDIHHNARWNAPELNSDEGYNEKVDIFSMGIIFWQLLACRSMPFEGHDQDEVYGLVMDEQRPYIDGSWDPSYVQVIGVAAALSLPNGVGACVEISGANWYQCGLAFRDTPESCSQAFLSFRIEREKSDCIVSNPIVKVDFAGPIVLDGFVFSGTEDIPGEVSEGRTSVLFDTTSDLDLGPAWVPIGESYLWYFTVYVDNCDTGFTYRDNFFELSYVDDEQNIIDLSGFDTPDDIFAPATGICPDDETPLSLSFEEWDDDDEMPLSLSFEEWNDDDEWADSCVGISGANWYQCGPAFRDTPESCSQAILSFRIERENIDCIVSNPIVKVDFAGPMVIDGTVHSGTDFISGQVSDDRTSVLFDTTSDRDLDPAWVPIGESYLWYFRFNVDNCDTGFTYRDNFFELSYVDDEQNIIDLSGFDTPDDIFAPANGICPDDETPLSLSFEEWDDDEPLSLSFEEWSVEDWNVDDA
eukprot:g17651.t1